MQKIARRPGRNVFSGGSVFKSFATAGMLLALLVMLVPGHAKAQGVTATMLGTVTDPTGAVVPGAKVTIENVNTGIKSVAVSNKTGDYIFNQLQIGAYSIRIDAKGFKTYTQTGITLNANSRVRVDAKLQVGSQAQTITVQSSASPALQTDSSTQDTLISTTDVANLPLNGRNVTKLVQLSAGVTQGAANAPGGAQWTGGHSDDLRQTSAFSANGENDMYNNQMVDGLDNNERSIGTQVIKPSIDAIDQVIVMTNLYPAEYGRTEGGIMNVITKSGTNNFHGTLYEYLRNDALDAYNYDFTGNPVKGEYRQNQFGGSLGGPIKKGKTFFFGDYEGFRVVSGLTTQTLTVPGPAIRAAMQGATAGSTVSFNDPLFPSTTPYTAKVTQLGLNMYKLYPKYQTDATTNNFAWTPNMRQNANSIDTRIDEHLTDNDLFFGRYSWNKTTTDVPAGLPSGTIGSYSYNHPSIAVLTTQGLGLDWTHTFTPNLIMVLKAGYTRFNNNAGVTNGVDAATHLGFAACSGIASAENPVYCINSPYGGASEGLPGIGVENYAGMGDAMWGPLNNINQTFQYMGSVTWVHNNHSIKTGLSLIRRQMSRVQSPSARGDYAINGLVTGDSMADMLEGIASNVQQQTTLSFPNFRAWEAAGYVQDDWRAKQWLTLNLGIRYSLYMPFTDKHGEFSNFNYAAGVIQSPSLLGIYKGSNSDDVAPDYSNVSPRLGFAATLSHQTVVRGGIGVSYFPNEEGGGTVVSMANFPYTWSADYGSSPYNVPVPAGMAWDQSTVTNGYTNCGSTGASATACAIDMQKGVTEPYLSASTVANLPTGTEIDGVANDLKSGRLVQYSLEIQKQIKANVIAIGYIGNQGRHLPDVPNVNQAAYATASGSNCTAAAWAAGTSNCVFTQGPTPYTSATTLDGQNLTGDSIYRTSSDATSNYNALQATFTRRLSKGLSATMNYTWSKIMNDGSPQGEGGNRPMECVRNGCIEDLGNGQTKIVNGFKAYDYGPGDLNMTQRFTAMVTYKLPFGKNLNGVAGYAVKGWNVNAIVVYDTGLPESVGENGGGPSANVSGINGFRGGDAPLQTGKIKYLHKNSEWFDTSVFAIQTPGTLGNAMRNVLTGPHQRHLDMSVAKNFPIYENMKLQFRADGFNVTNTPNFGLPNAGFRGPDFGKITSVNGHSRLVQFAMRLSF